MKKTLALTLLSCFLFGGNAFAADFGSNAFTAEPTNGAYVAPKLMLNFSNMDASYSENGQNSPDKSFSNTTFGGALAVGYDFDVKYNVPVRAELEFAMSGSGENTDNSAGVGISGEIGINTLMVNAYYDFENSSDFTPYVGLGAGIAWVKMEGDADSLGKIPSNTETNFTWNVGLGVAYDITERFSADLGYRFAQFGDAKTGSLSLGGAEGHLETETISTHQVMLGVRYTF